MRNRDKIAIGLIAGAGLAWGSRAWLRSRRRIELDDRVVLITGGTTGLGFLVAQHAAQEGARLVLAARDPAELQAAEAKLREEGAHDVLTVPTDIQDPDQVQALVAKTLARFGQIDILVNNAGTILVGPMEAMTLDDYRNVMATNFWGALYCTLAVLPAMRARGFGRIANVSSIGGKMAMPHLLPYTASKFALSGLTEGLRAELAKDNILVTGIYPHTIRTGGHTHAWFKGDQQAEYTWFALSDTVPGISASADLAARKLWAAVRDGEPEVVVGWPAKAAIAFRGLLPDWYGEAMALINRTLPAATNLDAPAVQGQALAGKVPSFLSHLIPAGTRPS